MGADGITKFWCYSVLAGVWQFFTSCNNEIALATSELLQKQYPNSFIVMAEQQPTFTVNFV